MGASTGIFCRLVGEAAAEASKLLKAPSHGPCRSHKIVGPARPRPARAAPALASPVVAAAAAPESVATSPICAPRSGRPSVGHPAWPPGFCHCQATPGSASLPLRRKFLPCAHRAKPGLLVPGSPPTRSMTSRRRCWPKGHALTSSVDHKPAGRQQAGRADRNQEQVQPRKHLVDVLHRMSRVGRGSCLPVQAQLYLHSRAAVPLHARSRGGGRQQHCLHCP